MKPLRFNHEMLTRKPPAGIDVETTLSHFAIVTYMVEPGALRPHVHERFEPDCITSDTGARKALISVVPFLDRDFRLTCCPWPRWAFGQTNYRAYVTDTESGERAAWFFGTSLDSLSVYIPRLAWKLPWHKARIHFNTRHDRQLGRYTEYRMTTTSRWAPAKLELEDSGTPPDELQGFPDLESGLVLLTHPLRGFFHRRDGKLGSYSIWHPRLRPTQGRATTAAFPLLQRLSLIQTGSLAEIHSVLIQPEIDFTIYLPPAAV